jgi:hypothetical protein
MLTATGPRPATKAVSFEKPFASAISGVMGGEKRVKTFNTVTATVQISQSTIRRTAF